MVSQLTFSPFVIVTKSGPKKVDLTPSIFCNCLEMENWVFSLWKLEDDIFLASTFLALGLGVSINYYMTV